MRPVRGARCPTMAPPLNFRFNANQQSGSSYPAAVPVEARVRRSGLNAKGFLHHQLHGVASALQDLSTTPVDGVVLCLSMFGDR